MTSVGPLRLSIVVQCGAAQAFFVFAEETTRWWPKTHSMSQSPDLTVTFEPRPGGRIFERTPDGREFDWGTVAVWDPPRRLAYSWHIRADARDATDVEITFTELPHGRTRVDIEHGGWERLGDRGPGRRDANVKGWSGILPHFISASGQKEEVQ
ncbi:MAG: SRPBCC family protein [Vicinamibacterales bacterium]